MRSGGANFYVARGELDRRLDEAEGYVMLRMPERALEVLHGRAIWAPRQFKANYLYGQALRLLGRYREALKPLEIAAAIDPQDVGAAIGLGWCYKRTHRLAQAIDALERVKRSSPLSVAVRYNLACYWCLAGNHRRALDELRAALDLKPSLRHQADRDSDFNALRRDAEFLRLCSLEPVSS